MLSNRLRLNPSKTKFMWCATSRRLHHIDSAPVNISGANITPSTTIRNLGVTMNNYFSMKSHIVNLSRSCFCSMRRIRGSRRMLTTEAAKTLITSFVCSRFDYCNTVFANLPASTIDRLDDVLQAAARLISGCRKYDHITPVMRDELHWLPIRQRMEYKLCLTVFKALHSAGQIQHWSKSTLVNVNTGQSQHWSKSAPVNVCTGQSQYWLKSALIKVNTGQSQQWSKSALVKVSTSQSQHWSKSALVKISTGQSQHPSKSAPFKVITGQSQHPSKSAPVKVSTRQS